VRNTLRAMRCAKQLGFVPEDRSEMKIYDAEQVKESLETI